MANAETVQTKIDTLTETFKTQARVMLALNSGILSVFNFMALPKLRTLGLQAKTTAQELEQELGLEPQEDRPIDQLKRIEAAAEALGSINVANLKFSNSQVEKMVEHLEKEGFKLTKVKEHFERQMKEEPKLRDFIYS